MHGAGKRRTGNEQNVYSSKLTCEGSGKYDEKNKNKEKEQIP